MTFEERQDGHDQGLWVYSKYKEKPMSTKQGSDMNHFMFLMRLKSGCFVALALTTVIDSSEEEKGTNLGHVLNIESAEGLVKIKNN